MIPERWREDYESEPDYDREDARRETLREPPPAAGSPSRRPEGPWRPPTMMAVLAWRVLNSPPEDAKDAARALAEKVLEASG